MGANFYLEKLYQDMQLQAHSEHTQDVYGRVVRDFLNFSRKPTESLNEQDVRNYTLHLMNGNLSKGSINTYQAAVRFFFGVTLNRTMNYLQMPWLKEDKVLPEILSQKEIALLLERCENPKHKAPGRAVVSRVKEPEQHRRKSDQQCVEEMAWGGWHFSGRIDPFAPPCLCHPSSGRWH